MFLLHAFLLLLLASCWHNSLLATTAHQSLPVLKDIRSLPAYVTDLCKTVLDGRLLTLHEKMVCQLLVEYSVVLRRDEPSTHRKLARVRTPRFFADINFSKLPDLLDKTVAKLQSGWRRLPGIESISITRPCRFYDEDSFYIALFDLAGLSACECFESILPCHSLMLTINIPALLVNDFDAFFNIAALHEICIDIAP